MCFILSCPLCPINHQTIFTILSPPLCLPSINHYHTMRFVLSPPLSSRPINHQTIFTILYPPLCLPSMNHYHTMHFVLSPPLSLLCLCHSSHELVFHQVLNFLSLLSPASISIIPPEDRYLITSFILSPPLSFLHTRHSWASCYPLLFPLLHLRHSS